MTGYVSDVAFSPAVKAWQEKMGARAGYARMEQKGGWKDGVTPELAAFLAERDSFYLATASAEGQPYIQHRGGPKGFLRMLDERTLAFADFAGNKQFISAGNLSENDRAQIFLMDYANRQRIKIWGRARVVEDDPALLGKLADPSYEGRLDRAIVFEIVAWDVNCPQHITRRYTEAEVATAVEKLTARIAELEAEVARLESAGTGPLDDPG
ncbi:MAG: pyridoxamine 5'-phosphate oxidase family protein [Rhodospirillales bacterium]|nr:pyridoxamine 5'-phosphate oxidase family protein [Rhodospirillales bacterium]MDH3790105.1 pyridoxamine 5'-phosphate oxidase family protein [Rhodospirillales bacterium]MDH3916571.1 pyridoxamine 5'-phosphate oxidase family protein [Rhodospirillales bacterium]MDH3965811.1 pyridoxamine 5'-phosphate oxidase family protein [Rhodospirillales bacterium]